MLLMQVYYKNKATEWLLLWYPLFEQRVSCHHNRFSTTLEPHEPYQCGQIVIYMLNPYLLSYQFVSASIYRHFYLTSQIITG
ncbi:hypothetical protein EUGRSUZ_D00840 [Eucalyptus grandis]|uniref:Uncharacterized protein n=2 Tax=Eucalyptus grandis TaxID=71139 RepID=A0ACC3L421_EUCGR|nr:hypothetical protein EUGRSUZ_D00840 [Eucalyptus grandis]